MNEQERKCFTNGGVFCPCCESRTFTSEGEETMNIFLRHHYFRCEDCGCKWTEFWDMSGIRIDNGSVK